MDFKVKRVQKMITWANKRELNFSYVFVWFKLWVWSFKRHFCRTPRSGGSVRPLALMRKPRSTVTQQGCVCVCVVCAQKQPALGSVRNPVLEEYKGGCSHTQYPLLGSMSTDKPHTLKTVIRGKQYLTYRIKGQNSLGTRNFIYSTFLY